jgi:hypothetical protein
MTILKYNKSNEDSIKQRVPINSMDKETLKKIKKINKSTKSLLDKTLVI